MRCAILTMLVAGLMCAPAMAPALAKDKAHTAQRAVPGAGWAAVPIPGHSGKAIYERYCLECHGAGPEHPGTQALAAKYRGAVPAELDQRTDLSTEFVISTVRHGVSVMPAERKTEIGDAELKSLAAYLAHEKD